MPQKLYNDLGTDIKFVKGIDVSLSASDIGKSENQESNEEERASRKAEEGDGEESADEETTESTTQNKNKQITAADRHEQGSLFHNRRGRQSRNKICVGGLRNIIIYSCRLAI
ncbi:MAG: hypothetical protein L6V88_11985 [Anaerotruncus sp.]|nr:MAG: hypothetical protein L6V88_11985 [Anaerotruncus sp.]